MSSGGSWSFGAFLGSFLGLCRDKMTHGQSPRGSTRGKVCVLVGDWGALTAAGKQRREK